MKTYLLNGPSVDNGYSGGEPKVSFTVGRTFGGETVERVQVDINLRLLTDFLFASLDDNTTDQTTLAYKSIVAKKV